MHRRCLRGNAREEVLVYADFKRIIQRKLIPKLLMEPDEKASLAEIIVRPMNRHIPGILQHSVLSVHRVLWRL